MTILTKAKNAWLVGIKGTGMTALAQILCRRGMRIAGSDTAEVFFTDEVLESSSIPVKSFSADNITSRIEAVIYSTAYAPDHPELKKARELNIPLLSYPEALGMLFQGKTGIAVCGTHGKTTTTALLGYVLQQADFDPTVVVGAPVPQYHGSALVGGSPYMVIEADEYQNKLAHYRPTAAILTNIDYDHPDFFESSEEYVKTFERFVKDMPEYGFLVANVDDDHVQKLLGKTRTQILTYGFVPSADWSIERIPQEKGDGQAFKIYHHRNFWAQGNTLLLGKYNLYNILAAVVTAEKLGVNQEVILKAVSRFRAPQRRCELKGVTDKGATVIDDFAHHPGEIQAVLFALREHYQRHNITVIFHPHTYSRTCALLERFAHSFKLADKVVVLDIYASAREQKGGVSSEDLVRAINNVSGNAVYKPSKEDAVEYVRERSGAGSVVVTMGAGDVWKIADQLLSL